MAAFAFFMAEKNLWAHDKGMFPTDWEYSSPLVGNIVPNARECCSRPVGNNREMLLILPSDQLLLPLHSIKLI